MADVPPPRSGAPPPRDDTSPSPEIEPEPVAGAPRYGWFAGVMEGRLGNADELRVVTEYIQSLGIVGCDLEIEGGRFSFMFDEQPVSGALLTVEKQDALVGGLRHLLAAAAGSGAIESTLRSSLVHRTSVIETLFAIREGQIEPVSRRRELEERDRAHDPGHAAGALEGSLISLGGKRAVVLAALILVGGVLLAWNRGYVDLLRNTFYARAAADLESSTGPFGDALVLTVEKKFGRYRCTIQRGPGYPATADAVEALIAAAVTAEDRAAANAIGNGGLIGVLLVDENGETVASAPIQLTGLLKDAEAEIDASIPSKLLGRRIELSLDAKGASKKRARPLDGGGD